MNSDDADPSFVYTDVGPRFSNHEKSGRLRMIKRTNLRNFASGTALVAGIIGVGIGVTLLQQASAAEPPASSPAVGNAIAARVTIVQKIDRDPRRLEVGDTLSRSINTFAEDTKAMMIPAPAIGAPAGVRMQRHDPAFSDFSAESPPGAGGLRVDPVTYTFESTGTYVLPAVEVSWVDPATGGLQRAVAPEIVVTVVDTTGRGAGIAVERLADAVRRGWQGGWFAWVTAAFAALAVALWLLRR
jgi:hypothetical protein